jgi:molecular chaperone DnaK (HSP70)
VIRSADFNLSDADEIRLSVVDLQLTYMGEKQTFTPGQLMTMILTKLKQTAEVALKTKVVDAVVSVSVIHISCFDGVHMYMLQ